MGKDALSPPGYSPPHHPPRTLPPSLPVRVEDLGGLQGLGGPEQLHGRKLAPRLLHGVRGLWPVGLVGTDSLGVSSGVGEQPAGQP